MYKNPIKLFYIIIKEQNKKDAESKILILENQIKFLEKEREMLKVNTDSKIQLEIKKIEELKGNS
ncbi:hypothetical protein [Mycoplasma phocimorsus]|uniref:Uncharacterized protein n=1 Tax=Mycoplasma phocimorsus TaxID=3045839 RepID=A0AAJ1UWU2_9MOLU|nr:hypothetical protein [Mycoplasma phocimorsus]MDJ1646032.1 hypothetical protein [Mycoplasma phocimorsus]MDJ1647233.1 hypothetical protein [Mycoplasma phocimorsus]MDJ1648413.1 hypothetical protein [Mycoplasma phocimorsus]